jgi:hypothetical protein
MSELSTVATAVQAAADAVRKHVQERAHTCPCCGQVILDALELIHMSPMERRIYDMVRRRMPYGINAADMFAAIYANDPNGGPLDQSVLHVNVHHLNARLKPHGLVVRSSHKKGRGAPYRIYALELK